LQNELSTHKYFYLRYFFLYLAVYSLLITVQGKGTTINKLTLLITHKNVNI